MRKALLKWGFIQLFSDNCIYYHVEYGIIIALYVDDLLIFGKTLKNVEKVKRLLSGEFEMKDMGELKFFLGIQVHRDRKARTIHINQSAYINKILHRFGMKESKPAPTPIATGTQLQKATEFDELADTTIYQSMVGSEMYTMLCTRPDLAYAISQTSQFSATPTRIHESVVKRGFRYLNGTRMDGITFSGSKHLKLSAYSDADWAGNKEDRKSISGFLATINGAAISWSSKKQTSVATSSTEAEYMALSGAVKEIIWIQRMFKELGRTLEDEKIIYEDNQGAIALAKNPEQHARTKHIDIQYHFIRECIENGYIELKYIPTEDMVADAMTKPLPKDRHRDLTARMGVGTLRRNITPSSVEVNHPTGKPNAKNRQHSIEWE